MYKAIKFKNDNYLDTIGAVHNGTILKTYLDNLKTSLTGLQNSLNNLESSLNKVDNKLNIINSREVLVGIYPIITAPRSGSNTNKLVIENRYNFKERILEGFPLNSNYNRKYIVQAAINTGTGSASVYLGGFLLFDHAVWGSNNNASMRTAYYDITNVINQMAEGHTEVSVTCPVFFYINKLDILIYDVPKN